MERNQIDLVDMKAYPVTKDGKLFRYVLAVLDVFSRYLVLRPLHSKTAVGVSRHLAEIYSMFGAPKVLQSDQGPEFKGAVPILMKFLNVAIVTSSQYHPQTQGKVCIVCM